MSDGEANRIITESSYTDHKLHLELFLKIVLDNRRSHHLAAEHYSTRVEMTWNLINR